MVRSICIRYNVTSVEDIIQDFYTHLIDHDVLNKYDPDHPTATKISTYLYRSIENLVRIHLKSNESKIKQHCVSQDYYDLFKQHDDDERMDLPVDQIKTEYENILYRNDFSDAIDGMNLDLDLFEDHLRKKNRHYTLNKRKNFLVGEKGMDLLRVFKLLREGYSNREIAHIYGVSDMFITTVKNEIKNLMIDFGIVWSYRTVRDGALQEVY
jgi:hypothetical protein